MRQPHHGAKPKSTTEAEHKGTRKGAGKGKTGLSPEVWESIVKALPGVIRAVAELVKVLGLH